MKYYPTFYFKLFTMTIPQELLQLSNKELYKTLDNKNLYTAKYFLTNNGDIVRLENKYKNIYTFRRLIDNHLFPIDVKYANLSVLTPQQIEVQKKSNIYKLLNTCSNEVFIEYIRKIAVDIYGEDRIDIRDYGDEWLGLIIYFPEITITNSHELSHTMYDIYVELTFTDNSGGRRLHNTRIARTTFSEKEIAANYIFSHCTGSIGDWSSTPCFGGTELSTIFRQLQKNELQYLYSFLMSLEEYLKWESLEGTPYKYISNLDTYQRYISQGWYSSNFKPFYNHILNKVPNFTYKFDIENGFYNIHLDKKSKKLVDDILTTDFPDCNYYLINRSSCVNGLNNYDNKISKYDGKNSVVCFKNEVKKIKVIKNTVDEVEPEKRIHRTILNEVVKLLETRFYNYLINKKLEETI